MGCTMSLIERWDGKGKVCCLRGFSLVLGTVMGWVVKGYGIVPTPDSSGVACMFQHRGLFLACHSRCATCTETTYDQRTSSPLPTEAAVSDIFEPQKEEAVKYGTIQRGFNNCD